MPYEVTARKTPKSKHKETKQVENEDEAAKEVVNFIKQGLIYVEMKELE